MICTTHFISLKFSAKSLTILQRVHPCARSLELDGCALIDLPNKRGEEGQQWQTLATVGLWDFNNNFGYTPIPRITRNLVLGKNRLTQKLLQGDCNNDSTNAEFPHLREIDQNLRHY